uniref:Uncharacterized protein n=1 Tax=Romanomermis culicivorax TaxID=13658 RepID=A0A915KYV0_ROMCU
MCQKLPIPLFRYQDRPMPVGIGIPAEFSISVNDNRQNSGAANEFVAPKFVIGVFDQLDKRDQ